MPDDATLNETDTTILLLRRQDMLCARLEELKVRLKEEVERNRICAAILAESESVRSQIKAGEFDLRARIMSCTNRVIQENPNGYQQYLQLEPHRP